MTFVLHLKDAIRDCESLEEAQKVAVEHWTRGARIFVESLTGPIPSRFWFFDGPGLGWAEGSLPRDSEDWPS